MLTSLRTKLKSLRKDPESTSHARLLRQAAKAERSVIQTAATDLEKWEQGKGYVKTSCRTSSSPAVSFQGTEKETGLTLAESERTLYERGGQGEAICRDGLETGSQSGLSVQRQSLDAVPQLQLPTITQDGMSLLGPPEDASPAESLGPDVSVTQAAEGQNASTSSQDVRADQVRHAAALKVLEEKEALLREIQQIRKTISDLRSGAAPAAISSEKPADPAPPTPESRPWLSAARTVSVYRPRRKSVADLFAEDAPQPMHSYHARGIAPSTTPRLGLSPELEAIAASRPSDLARRRSKSVGASTMLDTYGGLAGSGATSRPDAYRKSSTPAARPKTLYDQPSSFQSGENNEQRVIVVSEEEKKQRYRASLGRTDTRKASGVRDKTTSNRMSQMTLSELQERHLTKLLQLQRPTTTKLAEAQALTTAREQWQQRQAAERQAQEVKLRERQAREAQLATEANGKKSRGQSVRYSIRSRSKSVLAPAILSGNAIEIQVPHSEHESERPSTSLSTQLNAYNRPPERGEAINRADVWRQGVPSLSKAHTFEKENSSSQAVRQPPPFRAQSSLGLAPPHMANPEQAVRARSRRSHSSAGLLTMSQETSQPVPVASGGEQPGRQRRELTATDIRRIREGAGRRRSVCFA
ncbi:hypothetical protein BCV69DRAFT_280296 [Microstroma glucosiphilum]|uniref:Uncharacterized protein n=1 Tax=Pseudomicrostroma glucosiphilum TaxID=1684307 RepID=A0A316UHM9_9BASI|nr:hypothetical protein BCV69DRAFT_280296 [Pseudomicrostroma glucosiphilum]PWN22695.1 hypothetical protein BCV69DRAFT_280296 [Pseudomicrostroma glucosiphilum]